jgi:hypothetical protein
VVIELPNTKVGFVLMEKLGGIKPENPVFRIKETQDKATEDMVGYLNPNARVLLVT